MQLAVVEFARTSRASRGPTARSSTPPRPPSSTSCPSSARCATRARRCASAPTPARSPRAPSPPQAYGATEISERHRHRYEVNNDYRDALLAAGLVLSGTSPDKKLVEMVELSGHPYFVGCQFHPELKSRPHARRTRSFV
jgi:CTP synthase